MNNIEKAIQIALKAHQGQLDKAGKPYILHPIRLMCRLHVEIDIISALLHDVIEDSDYTAADLRREGVPEAAIEVIDHLTRKKNEPYEDFINRASRNEHAKRVKIADLEDNMDISRLNEITDKDIERLSKYHRSLNYLKSC